MYIYIMWIDDDPDVKIKILYMGLTIKYVS